MWLPDLLLRAPHVAILALTLATLPACAPSLPPGTRPDGTKSVLVSRLPSMDEASRRRVAELEDRRDWDGLAKLAEEGTARKRHEADWWLVAGYAHSMAGRHRRAVECFGERVRLAPDELLGWNLLAQSYRDAGQPHRAVQTLNNAHLVRRGTPETWYLLGESYSDLNHYQPAAAAYREALQLERGFAEAWFGLGRAYARLGRRAEYEQALQALQKLDPALAKKLAEVRPTSR